MHVKNFLERLRNQYSIPVDETGMWYQDNDVVVPSNQITMKGPNGEPDYFKEPIVGTGTTTGQTQIMEPGEEYEFPEDNEVLETKMQKGGSIEDNWFNKTFRDRELMKQEILNENPVLKNVLNSDNMNINYAKGSQRRLLQSLNHNPEYFDRDNNRNGILDNQNDTDEGYPYKGDINTDQGVVRNPNPGQYTTLINKKGLSRQQIKDIATNDFISHALHTDPTYQALNSQLEKRLISRYGKDMVEANGGADAYVRGMISNNPEYAPYKKEMEFLDPEFLNMYQSYLSTGQPPNTLKTQNKYAPGFQMGGMSIPGVNGTVVGSSPSLYTKYKNKK